MLELFYSTGCRVSEMVRLNKKDVDFSTGEVHLFGKGKKHRTAYLNAKAELRLKQYLESRNDDNEALFVSVRKPYRRLSKEGIEYVVRRIGERSGIGRSLYPHLIRHTTGTDALNRGMPITELKEMFGHSKLDTTLIYAKESKENIKYHHSKYIV